MVAVLLDNACQAGGGYFDGGFWVLLGDLNVKS